MIEERPAYTLKRRINYRLYQYHIKKKHSYLLSRPINIIVELTNRCNFKCLYCARNYWDKKLNPPGDLDKKIAKKIFPLFATAERVRLAGHGEPFLSPTFWYVLEAVKKAGAIAETNTNSSTLTDEVLEKLVDYQLDVLMISIDGARNETMKLIRGITVDEILKKIERLNEIKKRRGSAKPRLQPAYTVMKENLKEMPEIVEMCPDLGIKSVHFNHVRVWDRAYADQPVYLYPDLMEKYFNETAKVAESLGIKVTIPSLGGIKHKCMDTFNTFYLRWQGDVRGCCYAAFDIDGWDLSLGDITKKSALAIWNGKKFRASRRALLGLEKNSSFCVSCTASGKFLAEDRY